MKRHPNQYISLKQFFKRNGKRIAVLTCGIYLFHIVAPVYYAKLQAELYMTVSGKVIDKETGEGVEKAVVMLFEAKNTASIKKSDFTTTRKNGQFIFNLVPPGEYVLFVHPPTDSGYATDLEPVTIIVQRGKNIINLILQLQVGGSLSGIVLAPDGVTKLGSVHVTATSKDGGIGKTTTDANGNYKITNLKPGTYAVQMLFEGEATTLTENVIVVSGQTTQNINLMLNSNRATFFKGIVRSKTAGDIITNASVFIFSDKEGGFSRSDVEGKYKVSGLTGGFYNLLIFRDGFDPLIRTGISIVQGQENRLELELEPSLNQTSNSEFMQHEEMRSKSLIKSRFLASDAFAQVPNLQNFEACMANCGFHEITQLICFFSTLWFTGKTILVALEEFGKPVFAGVGARGLAGLTLAGWFGLAFIALLSVCLGSFCSCAVCGFHCKTTCSNAPSDEDILNRCFEDNICLMPVNWITDLLNALKKR